MACAVLLKCVLPDGLRRTAYVLLREAGFQFLLQTILNLLLGAKQSFLDGLQRDTDTLAHRGRHQVFAITQFDALTIRGIQLGDTISQCIEFFVERVACQLADAFLASR